MAALSSSDIVVPFELNATERPIEIGDLVNFLPYVRSNPPPDGGIDYRGEITLVIRGDDGELIIEVGSYVTDVYDGDWSISYDSVKQKYIAVRDEDDDIKFNVEFHPSPNSQDVGGSDLYLEEYFTNTLDRIKSGLRNPLPLNQLLIASSPESETLYEGIIYWKTILFDPIITRHMETVKTPTTMKIYGDREWSEHVVSNLNLLVGNYNNTSDQHANAVRFAGEYDEVKRKYLESAGSVIKPVR
jgi:hypothetical protein